MRPILLLSFLAVANVASAQTVSKATLMRIDANARVADRVNALAKKLNKGGFYGSIRVNANDLVMSDRSTDPEIRPRLVREAAKGGVSLKFENPNSWE